MGRSFEKASGRISLRIPVELHAELGALSQLLGVDVNSLVNLMVRDGLPNYLAKAGVYQHLPSALKSMPEFWVELAKGQLAPEAFQPMTVDEKFMSPIEWAAGKLGAGDSPAHIRKMLGDICSNPKAALDAFEWAEKLSKATAPEKKHHAKKPKGKK